MPRAVRHACGRPADIGLHLRTRAVHSEDGMTADWVPLPCEVLKMISSCFVNEIRGVNPSSTTSHPRRRGPLSGSGARGNLNLLLNELIASA
jgi:hypothetical protein